MNNKDLNLLLIKKFPNLKEKYCKEVDWQEGDETGSHVVYGDVFSPYIEDIIEKNNTKMVKNVFEFIEDILIMNDKYSSEVVLYSVLERLVSDSNKIQYCKKYFGLCTANMVRIHFNLY